MFYVGHAALEPTLGITEKGSVFYTAAYSPVDVMRSTDQGRTWDVVSPMIGEQNLHPFSLDPYLFVDPATSRVFTVDLIPCPHISYSDDEGASWVTHSLPCEQTDHQNLFAGPPVMSATAGYPNVVYYCAISGGTLASTSTATACSKSLDGGISFVPTGAPAFTDDPNQTEGHYFVRGHCAGATGHGTVDRAGTVYLPRGWCGQPWLAISRDEGATWTRVRVADNGFLADDSGSPSHEAGVGVDPAGNVYYAWVAADKLPYLSISRDEGKTWSEPMMIGPPGLDRASLPGIAVGGNGKVAIVYMGTTNYDAEGCGPAGCAVGTWNGYVTISADALDTDPLFYTASVNDPSDPLLTGYCGATRCGAEFDFIDVQIAPDGTPWAGLVDGCMPGNCPPSTERVPNPARQPREGVAGHLVGGPSLR